ncbi:MAG: FHA domain-containing protein [Gemmataceae bacterium]
MSASLVPDPPRDDEEGAPPISTRVESMEEIRQALLSRQRKSTPTAAGPADDTVVYRPVLRPPLLLLCILDDGSQEGEWLRIRGDSVTIGRQNCDVVISHDGQMSGRHAEVSRRLEGGRYRWHLIDLQSLNGTFARVSRSLLRAGQELMIGANRFRFDLPAPGAGAEPDQPPATGTSGWQKITPSHLLPSLVELSPQGEGERHLLNKTEAWIGRDPQRCAIVLDDPLVSPRHARLRRDDRGRWQIENAKSVNGVWLRIDSIPISSTCQFQLGEQRFFARVV